MRLLPLLLPVLLAACGQAPSSPEGRTPEEPMRGTGATCEVHGDTLRAVEVDIEYGLPIAPGRSWVAAAEALFPHATEAPNGGCVPRGGTARIEVCRSCDEVRAAWEKDHPRWASDYVACPQHGDLLVDGELRLLAGMYGLPTPGFLAARESQFPYAFADWVTGSCVASGPATIPVSYCPSCRTTRAAWLQEHKRFTTR